MASQLHTRNNFNLSVPPPRGRYCTSSNANKTISSEILFHSLKASNFVFRFPNDRTKYSNSNDCSSFSTIVTVSGNLETNALPDRFELDLQHSTSYGKIGIR
jgi:hypothetical protein